jgi:antitoxin component of MazEF toxin-antitoxin module
MPVPRKITVEIPPALLKKAQLASGKGITQTVRTGLELLAASQAYDRALKLHGKVRLSRTWRQLKDDR